MTSPGQSFGFNVVGYISGNLGLGVAARHVSSLVLERNLPLAVLDIDPQGEGSEHDVSFRGHAISSAEALPYGITLFVLPPQTLFAFRQDPKTRPLLLRREGIQSAFLMWEHSRLPRLWRSTLRILDVIVAASHFVRSACDTTLDGVLTIPAAFPLRLPDVAPSRERFQLPSNAVIFVTSFEAYGADRKNPLGAVAAFRRALPNDRNAMLVIKVNNPIAGRAPHPIVTRLRDECVGDSRLRLIEEPMSYRDVLTLYASCDAFVSLHRSEGLGLGLMEAMALGKPVIGTAWSGNMSFMNATNSCLVSYRLVPVRSSLDVYSRRLLGSRALWADADIDDAATWMKRLVAEPLTRAKIGLRAAESMEAHVREANHGAFLDELTSIYNDLPMMASFQTKKGRVPETERRLLRSDKRRAVWASVERVLDRHLLWRIKRWFPRG